MKYIIFISLLIAQQYCCAQLGGDNVMASSKKILAIARPTTTEIKLRWAPASYTTWRTYNVQGYRIERVTITKAGKISPSQYIKVIATQIKPAALDDWKEIAQANKYAAIAAYTLYGNDFKVTASGNAPAAKILNKVKEDEQRYTFCLFSADQSYEVAQKTGLAFIDKEAATDETYLYRIITKSMEGVADTGLVLSGIPEYKPLPKINDVAATFSDKSVMLNWNHAIVQDVYNSYTIEKSTDGKNFTIVNNDPFAPFTDKLYNGITVFADSIANNNTPYYYRLKGKNAFGEEGPYSIIVKGEGKHILTAYPTNVQATIVDENIIKLNWDFPEKAMAGLKDFKIIRAPKDNGIYDTIVANINTAQRELVVNFTGATKKTGIPVNKALLASNYIAIAATNKDGSTTASFPVLVQPADAIAPAAPQQVVGTIDSATGAVLLRWKPNTEDDLLGYRIFRANKKGEELYQITSSPIDSAFFKDTIQVVSLNNTVYYKVVAVDQRYNMSIASTILGLKKPFRIQPTAPVFNAYQILDKKVQLSWMPSSTAGVIKHVLYKQQLNNAPENTGKENIVNTTSMKLVKEIAIKDKTGLYTDNDMQTDTYYQYAVQAVHENGNASTVASQLVFYTKNTGKIKPVITIKNANVSKDKTALQAILNWQFEGNATVKEVYVYKGINNSAITLLEMLAGHNKSFIDKDVEKDNKYTYAVRAILSNGTQTQLFNLGKVNF